MTSEDYMRRALVLARRALSTGDVPVGCVVADADGAIIGEGWNLREHLQSPTAHAEILAIEQAAKPKGTPWPTPRWRPFATPAGAGAVGTCTAAPSM